MCAATYACASAIHPDSDKGQAIQHYDRAVAFYAKERYPDAIEAYQLALQSWGNYREAHFGLGTAFIKTGFFRGAVLALNRAIALQPHYPEAYVNLGVAQTGLERYADATGSFLAALEQDPALESVWVPLAQSYAARGLADSAIAAYKESVPLHPYASNTAIAKLYADSGDAENQLVYLEAAARSDTTRADSWIALAEYYESADQLGKAAEALKVGLDRDPDFPGLLLKLAGLYASAGDSEQAARHYRIGIIKEPENATIPFNLGAVYDVMGRLEDAIAAYESAISLRPDFADAHLNLAIDFMALRRFPDALGAYEAFLSLSEVSDPRRVQVDGIVQKLRTALGK